MSKLAKLKAQLQTAEIDALLVTRPENRFYISGFQGRLMLLLL